MDFISLRQGPIVPVQAIELAIDLELRGIRIQRSADKLIVSPPELSESERSLIRQFKPHLMAVAMYCEQNHEGEHNGTKDGQGIQR